VLFHSSGGYTAKKGEVDFRKWFDRINEIHAIVGKVPLVALTATATTLTSNNVLPGDEASVVDRKPKQT